MKKILSLLLSMVLVFSLAACGGENSSSSDNGSSESSVQSSELAAQSSEVPAESETPVESEDSAVSAESTGEMGGILIAYFSWSGNTEQMAQMIQEETGGDLFEIEPATPYTDDYDTLLDVAQQEQQEDARPELAAQVEGWDGTATTWCLSATRTGGATRPC